MFADNADEVGLVETSGASEDNNIYYLVAGTILKVISSSSRLRRIFCSQSSNIIFISVILLYAPSKSYNARNDDFAPPEQRFVVGF